MKALKWLVLCLALSMAACQPADEETSNEPECAGVSVKTEKCDEIRELMLDEWESCLEQGADPEADEMMRSAIDIIRSMCQAPYVGFCTDPTLLDECATPAGFSCVVSISDIRLSYACSDILGLHE